MKGGTDASGSFGYTDFQVKGSATGNVRSGGNESKEAHHRVAARSWGHYTRTGKLCLCATVTIHKSHPCVPFFDVALVH